MSASWRAYTPALAYSLPQSSAAQPLPPATPSMMQRRAQKATAFIGDAWDRDATRAQPGRGCPQPRRGSAQLHPRVPPV
eukprot:9805195-Alexandrium_andersonii.AAC.1